MVILAKAGIQFFQLFSGSRLRGNDGKRCFSKVSLIPFIVFRIEPSIQQSKSGKVSKTYQETHECLVPADGVQSLQSIKNFEHCTAE